MPKLAHHPADFGVFGKIHMPILVTVLAGILNLIWICCGDGEILNVVTENLMLIQHSNTLITFTYTQIHLHTLKYTQIHSNTIIILTFTHINKHTLTHLHTLKYNHNIHIHSHTLMTITKIPYSHINS